MTHESGHDTTRAAGEFLRALETGGFPPSKLGTPDTRTRNTLEEERRELFEEAVSALAAENTETVWDASLYLLRHLARQPGSSAWRATAVSAFIQ